MYVAFWPKINGVVSELLVTSSAVSKEQLREEVKQTCRLVSSMKKVFKISILSLVSKMYTLVLWQRKEFHQIHCYNLLCCCFQQLSIIQHHKKSHVNVPFLVKNLRICKLQYLIAPIVQVTKSLTITTTLPKNSYNL